jgi:AcrR family transcriptional regulator
MAHQFIRPQKKQSQTNPLHEMPALFDAALTEFSEKPFDNASLNEIIKTSGISKGSFYHKFKNKTDLYLCVMDVISQQKAAYIRDVQMPDDFFEQLRLMFRQGLEFARNEPRYDAFWRLHLAEGAAIKEEVHRAFPNQRSDALEMLIKHAADKGQFKKDFPVSFVGGMIGLLISHMDTLISPQMNHADILSLVDHVVSMLKTGLQEPR